MANDFYNRGASFNPDELADGDAIEAEFDAVSRGFDTIEELVNANMAGYPSQTFYVAPAVESAHAIQKAQLDSAVSDLTDEINTKLDAVDYNAPDVLAKMKTVDGAGSGLDADLLDGLHESQFLRSDVADTINATLTLASGAKIKLANTYNYGIRDSNNARVLDVADGVLRLGDSASHSILRLHTTSLTGFKANVSGVDYTLWHSGNDGSGSGLDADLLDGLHASSFLRSDSASTTSYAVTLAGGVSTSGKDVYTGNGAIITSDGDGEFSARGGTNIDHIWHDYSTNTWHFCSDTTYKSTGNAIVKADTFSGNAETATTLKTAMTINGVSFNGSANITVEPYVEADASAATRYVTFVDSGTAGYQRLNMDSRLTYNPSTNVLGATISGNASTATKLKTARTIALSGDVTGSVAFDGSANATITADISDAGVLTSCAAAAAGSVGTYAFLRCNTNYDFGATLAGSSLYTSGVFRSVSSGNAYIYEGGATVSGTWRCMGYLHGNDGGYGIIHATLWLRIS